MADIEKVIKGLTCCKGAGCEGCPYFTGDSSCLDDKDKEALELLKEQQNRIKTLEIVNGIKLDPKWPYVFDTYRKVVLCKDCRHYDYCYVRPMSDREWFCADGERK